MIKKRGERAKVELRRDGATVAGKTDGKTLENGRFVTCTFVRTKARAYTMSQLGGFAKNGYSIRAAGDS
jgi:hypothetical protein